MKTCLKVALVLATALCLTQISNAATWNVPGDFNTIQTAIDSAAVQNGDTILVGAGNFAGAFVSKSLDIKGADGAIINSGPKHGSGKIMGFRLLAGADGSTISHFTFEVDFPVMAGAKLENITVTQNKMKNCMQGISAWRASGWQITHNDIVDLYSNDGGGIGILIGDYTGGIVMDNVISHNTITGTLRVSATDSGGYNGSGIVVYADYRWGFVGAEAITANQITKNKVAVSVEDPGNTGVGFAACELTEARDTSAPAVIKDNVISFNDFRGTQLQLVCTPAMLDNPANVISRNFGENRGHGLLPKLFKAE